MTRSDLEEKILRFIVKGKNGEFVGETKGVDKAFWLFLTSYVSMISAANEFCDFAEMLGLLEEGV